MRPLGAACSNMNRFLALPWRRLDGHAQAQRLLSAYIDGWVSVAERRMLENHLERCGLCQEDLETLRATAELLRRVQPMPSPRRLILVAPPAPSLGPRAWPLPMASVTAGVLLAFVVGADAAGVLPQGQPFATSPSPAAEAISPAGRFLLPSAGIAATPAPAPAAAQAVPAPMDARAAEAPTEPSAASKGSEQAPPAPGSPGAATAGELNPWRFVEAVLGVITLASLTLWAKRARRGAKP